MSPEVTRSLEERGCAVEAVGPLLVSPDDGRDLDPVSPRCEDSRSNSEPRDALLFSETLGADACGVGFGVLSAPSRPPMRLVPVRSGASIRCGGAYIREVSTGALGAILSVARGVRSGCADLLSIRSNTDPRLGALGAEGTLSLGVAGALPDRLGALTAGGLLRTTGPCDRLSARGLNDGWDGRDGVGDGADIRGPGDGWNDRDGADIRGLGDGWNERDEGEGADGRELNDWLRPDIDDPMLGPPPPRFPNDGDGAADRLGAGALGADRDTWLEPPPPPRLPPPLPCP